MLKNRARMLSVARHFFSERGILEVDCPLLSKSACIDAHIDLMKTTQERYLHSSPEYGMKRLISEGIGDIYQLAHVFRQDESGIRHNPEFMMAEWYRMGIDFNAMIDETVDFIRLFTKELPKRQLSYREALLEYAGIDYAQMNDKELMEYAASHDIALYEGIENEGVDAILNILLATLVEPKIGLGELTVITHYPASQAALAKKVLIDGIDVAERYEIYHKGIELANGYHELGDAQEQETRLHEANQLRRKLGKAELPIDRNFLNALKKGLPDCCGVAVGFDRLLMLQQETEDIADVIPFAWSVA
jgi:lysyl-tRNA synthetase class 2